MTTIFLSGSRKITRLTDLIRDRLHNIIQHGFSVIVGDASGADKAMQTFLAERGYANVSVYFAGPLCRNNIGSWASQRILVDPKLRGRALHTEKDRAMAAKADYGFVLWDGKSVGSITNVCELLTQRKTSAVYFSARREFINVSNVEDLNNILSFCELKDARDLENSSILKHQLSKLDVLAQQSFDL